MVAYTFKARFVPKIKSGLKTCTIRAPRGCRDRAKLKDRHAYAGEPMTLLTGQRMKPQALGKSLCVTRAAITILWHPQIEIIEAGEKLSPDRFDRFAIDDGFEDIDDMARFWADVHHIDRFEGLHLYWDPAPILAFWHKAFLASLCEAGT